MGKTSDFQKAANRERKPKHRKDTLTDEEKLQSVECIIALATATEAEMLDAKSQPRKAFTEMNDDEIQLGRGLLFFWETLLEEEPRKAEDLKDATRDGYYQALDLFFALINGTEHPVHKFLETVKRRANNKGIRQQPPGREQLLRVECVAALETYSLLTKCGYRQAAIILSNAIDEAGLPERSANQIRAYQKPKSQGDIFENLLNRALNWYKQEAQEPEDILKYFARAYAMYSSP